MIRLAKLWLMAGLLAFGLAMPAAAQLQVRVVHPEGSVDRRPAALPGLADHPDRGPCRRRV